MPASPRRNSQTTPNWASEQLSANRYAAGAAVAALLAAYLLAGPTRRRRRIKRSLLSNAVLVTSTSHRAGRLQ